MLTLLPLACLFTPCSLQAAPGEETPSVMRTYDVRGAVPGAGIPDNELVLLPLSRDFDGSTRATVMRGRPDSDANPVVTFLRSLDPPQWEYEGRAIDLVDESHLRVLAPPALQDVVTRGLAFLEDTVARPTTFVVDMVAFGPNPGVATLPLLLPATEVARWTAIGTGHESYELTLRPGELCLQRAERSVSFALETDPMVAERAAGFALYPERLAVGTVIELAVAPGKAGSWLALVLRNGRFLDTESMRDEALHSATTHDQATEIGDSQKVRSDPRLANHSFTINAFVPDGKALAFVTSAGLESRVVFIRQSGPTPPTTTGLPEELKRVTSRNETVLVRKDCVSLPVASVRTDLTNSSLARLASLDAFVNRDSGEAKIAAGIRWMVGSEASDYLFSEEYELNEIGPFVAISSASRAPVEKALARLSQLTPEPHSLAVTLTLRRGSRDTATLARAAIPLRAGATSTVVLCRESAADLSVQCDVAQGLVAMDTTVGRLFDGMTVAITPTMMFGGGLALGLDAHGRWSRSLPHEHEAGGPLGARVQLPDADLLDVERSVTFAKGDGSTRKVTIGNSGTSTEALTLDVEVVDLR
jgi:hypothetical protein